MTVLCIVFHITKKEKKKHLICKRKIYAKPNSTFNGVKVKGEQETGAQISIWNNIVHVLFPMRTGTDEGINSFATVTSLAATMIVMSVTVWDGRTLENLWEHEENCRSSTLKSSSFVSSSSVSRWWYLSERAGNDETFRFQNVFYCIQLLKCHKVILVEDKILLCTDHMGLCYGHFINSTLFLRNLVWSVIFRIREWRNAHQCAEHNDSTGVEKNSRTHNNQHFNMTIFICVFIYCISIPRRRLSMSKHCSFFCVHRSYKCMTVFLHTYHFGMAEGSKYYNTHEP